MLKMSRAEQIKSSWFPYPSSFCSPVHAADKDSQQFEIDQEKGKESLQKLDQQLQALSKKQAQPSQD
ncbi:hypothetical protein SLEP1_g32147 [Rubroshorea leprosula]|uniref:Uncharacterized protein n=1 Tax=Rubroshorea leprosula TaxID=152421 RepID=A0AAV5KCK4_9ROSI|nr:hypothetical protein SLEP1_g32147 [Rubroshorea leprosula]